MRPAEPRIVIVVVESGVIVRGISRCLRGPEPELELELVPGISIII